MDKIKTRLADENDVEGIVALEQKEGWPVDKEEVRHWLKYTDGYFLVAEYEGKIVGCVSATILNDEQYFNGNLVTDDAFRGMGLAKRLGRECFVRAGKRELIFTSAEYHFDMYERHCAKECNVDLTTRDTEPVTCLMETRLASQEPESSVVVKEIGDDDLEHVFNYDQKIIRVRRENWLRQWTMSTASISIVAKDNGLICGYAIASKCLGQYKISPLYANSETIAKNIVWKLMSLVPEGSTFVMYTNDERDQVRHLIVNYNEVKRVPYHYVYSKKDFAGIDEDKVFFRSDPGMYRA